MNLRDIAARAGVDAENGLKSTLHTARVSAAPMERIAQHYRLLKSIYGAAVFVLIGTVVTIVIWAKSPLMALLVGLFTIGIGFLIVRMIHSFKAMTALWKKWPVDRAEEFTDDYRLDLALAKAEPLKWVVPMMACWTIASAIGGAWAFVAAAWFVGLFVWIFTVGFVITARDARRRMGVVAVGVQAAIERESSDPEVVRGLHTYNAVFESGGSRDGAQPVSRSTQVLWRCQINTNGLKGMRTVRGDGVVEERAPQDVLVITDDGIDLVNIMEPPQPWDGLGQAGVTDAATAQMLSDSFGGVSSLRDLADLGGRKLDSVVAKHGYGAVADADPRNILFARDNIAAAGVYKRRFIPSYYFELQLIDGTTDRRDVMAARDRLEELRTLLLELGYPPR